MWKKRKTLIEVTPNWLSSGIFANLASWAPWNEEETATTTALNLLYYGERSGDKLISPLIERIMGTNTTLGSNDLTQLSGALRAKYGLSWAKLWETLYFEYNPIENYSMTEHEEIERSDSATNSKTGMSGNTRTDNLTNQRTDNLTSQRTDNLTSQRTDNLSASSTTSTEGESSGTNSVYGVNAATATPSDEQEATTSGSSSGTTTNTGTQTTQDTGTQATVNTGTQTVTNTGTQTDAGTTSESGSEAREGTEERNHTRSGNIGVTTSQQMIESERQLWLWSYFDRVFADIDELFTLPVY